MQIEIIDGEYAVCQIQKGQNADRWIDRSYFWSVTETDEEVSVICTDRNIPERVKKEAGWRLTRISGVLDFSLVGILVQVIQPLAERGISVFTISTFNTDYILLKDDCLEEAMQVWREHGFDIRRGNHD